MLDRVVKALQDQRQRLIEQTHSACASIDEDSASIETLARYRRVLRQGSTRRARLHERVWDHRHVHRARERGAKGCIQQEGWLQDNDVEVKVQHALNAGLDGPTDALQLQRKKRRFLAPVGEGAARPKLPCVHPSVFLQ